MSLEGCSLIRLNPLVERKPFDCLDADLNDFFHHDSCDYLNKLLAVTYILENENHTVAFFSMINDKLTIDTAKSKSWWKKYIEGSLPHGKRFDYYPAVKLGRLGVHSNYQSQGIGRILIDYIKNLFITNNRTGCKYISVDAYNKPRVLKFYSDNGFDFFTETDINDQTRLMYFDLQTVVPTPLPF